MSSERSRPPRVLFAGGGTGGHLYPAIALAEAFQRRDPRTEILFVGAKRGVEARVLPDRGIAHELLPFEPIRRQRPWENWRLVPSLLRSATGLARLFDRFRPDLVVGTGGYASGPAVGWAILRGVPTALQEQNSYPGLTTRWLASRTRQLHLAFPEARRYLKPGPRTEVFEFGNPITPPDFSIDRDEARRTFGLASGPVVLVVGGSQGARAINEALLQALRQVGTGSLTRPAGVQILWATGPSHIDHVRAELQKVAVGDWVHAVGYIHEMPKALAVADVAIARAGAMTLAELCAWGIPSVLIPFPHAAANHQYHNAAALDEAGAASMITEDHLDAATLWSKLHSLAGDPEQRRRVAERARERGQPDAADRIVDRLSKLLG